MLHHLDNTKSGTIPLELPVLHGRFFAV